MNRPPRLPLLILLLGFGNSHAAIDGVLLDSTSQAPLAGVSVTVEASGKSRTLPAATGPDGRFSLDPPGLFSASELDTVALVLTFRRNDYREIIRVLRTPTRGRFAAQTLRVSMERVAGATSLTTEVREALRAQRSIGGDTLYMLPYQIEGQDSARLNRALMFHLKRGINSHLQSMNLPDVAIAQFPLEVDSFNTEQVRAYGNELNALAVVSGIGTVPASGAGGSVEVASEYVIIPAAPRYVPRTLYVDDRFASADLNSTRLFEQLQKIWGQSTVLAMSVREVQRAQETGDRAGLQRALDYLQAERRLADARSAELVKELDTLIELLRQELQP